MTKYQHPVDAHVGSRLRLRRALMGWSQEKLGHAIGLTFQQIQKYEKGANRISCSRLYEFARLLEVPPSYFFDNLPANTGPEPGKGVSHAGIGMDTRAPVTPSRAPRDTLELLRAFEALPNVAMRHAVLRLVKALAESMSEALTDETAKAG